MKTSPNSANSWRRNAASPQPFTFATCSCAKKNFRVRPSRLRRSVWNSAYLLTFFESVVSGCVQKMSLEFEYRRLAAACLGLSKRSAAIADKTRLLLIAEAWFDLADRVARKGGNAKRRNDTSAEHPLVQPTLSSSQTAGPLSSPPDPLGTDRGRHAMSLCCAPGPVARETRRV